ncbi:MAG: helveticin J family class III bacteriocin, partial [Lentilactobacillus hilgardii]
MTNFGHTETLDYFEYNNQPYFWIGTKPTDNSAATYPWASQIGRLPIDGEDKDGNTSIERISSISSANADGKPAFELLRCEAALSSTTHRLFILGQDADENKQLTVYDANKINNLL